jgi:indoleamine 2,3-dioxygenase
MKWQLLERGFLPTPDPVARLNGSDWQPIESLAADLPRLVHEHSFRATAVDVLHRPIAWDSALDSSDDSQRERLFMLFSYFASAYVHAPGLPPAQQLPVAIAQPLVRLGHICDRPPILSYASYCLHNWRRSDPSGPIALGNIELLQNFSLPGEGKKDEDWFILVHVDIEARAGAALRAASQIGTALERHDQAGLEQLLTSIQGSLQAMNRTMERVPERCSPEVYFRKVRPYIFGFTDVVYEGCFDNQPQSYRGETGAQSSIVPSMLAALGIRHQDSLLTKHLNDMRGYMPPPHRRFIESVADVRPAVLRARSALKDLYNSCLKELLAFRTRHFEYAVNYIEKKVSNPLATGGTPYIPWLRQLIEESKGYYVNKSP